MRDLLFRLQASSASGLQTQIREQLVSMILSGHLSLDQRLPSSRHLAQALGVSRNTVTLAYQKLIDDGFLVARERSGYYVNKAVVHTQRKAANGTAATSLDWTGRFRVRPSRQDNINKPSDWRSYPYPFIFGQVDEALFPISDWRECSRRALGRQWLDAWTADHQARDDAMLIEQIRKQILPRRGIVASEDEILVTVGAQNALYILASLLTTSRTRVAIENPGYPDVRNILQLRAEAVVPIDVDEHGMKIDEAVLEDCQLVYVTPSHQAPTTVTLSPERRTKLLELASKHDFLILEDDYELETNFVSRPSPALKAADREGRVVYVSSLSKTMFPGLRLGFLVAAPEVVAEARALRRLMVRHPPNQNQRTTALFMALGHHDALLMRLRRAYGARWQAMRSALAEHLPGFRIAPGTGGSSVWVEGPSNFDAVRLAREALEHGIILEPGDIYFSDRPAPRNRFRLGFSSIDETRIPEGVAKLAKLVVS